MFLCSAIHTANSQQEQSGFSILSKDALTYWQQSIWTSYNVLCPKSPPHSLELCDTGFLTETGVHVMDDNVFWTKLAALSGFELNANVGTLTCSQTQCKPVEVKVEINSLDWLNRQSACSFPWDVFDQWQTKAWWKWSKKVRNQFKHQCCHYSITITLCSEHVLHNDSSSSSSCWDLNCWDFRQNTKSHEQVNLITAPAGKSGDAFSHKLRPLGTINVRAQFCAIHSICFI